MSKRKNNVSPGQLKHLFCVEINSRKSFDSNGNNPIKAKPPRPPKGEMDPIYRSASTCKVYTQTCKEFAAWVKKLDPKVKTPEDCRRYVGEYLEYRVEKGYSPYTLHKDACALGKFYKCPSKEFGVELPRTSDHEVTRSRNPVEHDRHFSEERNAELVGFARGTGLRRSELCALRRDDFCYGDKLPHSDVVPKCYSRDPETLYVHVISGKGGRERFVPVREEYKELVAGRMDGSHEKVFVRVHSAADIHSYRSEYARAVYADHARDTNGLIKKDVYFCRGEHKGERYDKLALSYTSQALGHNRLSVAVNSYIRR